MCLTSLLGIDIIMTRKLGKGRFCSMNKEKILESSRRENKNRDLAEMEVTAQAGNIAGRVGAHSYLSYLHKNILSESVGCLF